MNWNKEAEQIMEERFGGDNEMALATCRDNVPSVRTVNATYWEGVLLRHHLRPVPKNGGNTGQPTVALSGEWFTCHGTAKSLGWFGKRKQACATAHLRQLDRQRPQ